MWGLSCLFLFARMLPACCLHGRESEVACLRENHTCGQFLLAGREANRPEEVWHCQKIGRGRWCECVCERVFVGLIANRQRGNKSQFSLATSFPLRLLQRQAHKMRRSPDVGCPSGQVQFCSIPDGHLAANFHTTPHWPHMLCMSSAAQQRGRRVHNISGQTSYVSIILHAHTFIFGAILLRCCYWRKLCCHLR